MADRHPDEVSAVAQPLPLAGVRVLELATRDTAAQLCGRLLSDLGAAVTCAPDGGSSERTGPQGEYDERRRSHGRTTASAEAALDLLGVVDVLIVDDAWLNRLAQLGRTTTSLGQEFPALVLCAVTGYGLSGPLAGRSSSDLVLQAMTGLASTNGDDGDPPLRAGIPVPTIMGGLSGAIGIVAALIARRHSRAGQVVDVALFDATLCCLGTLLPTVFLTGRSPARIGNRHQMTAPWNAYPSSDGWVVISTMGEPLWAKVARMIERPELIVDPRFATTEARVAHVEELDAVISRWTGRRSTHEVRRWCDKEQIPAGSIPTLGEVLTDWSPRGPVPAHDQRPSDLPLPASPVPVAAGQVRTPPVVRDGEAAAAGDSSEPPLAGIRVLEVGAFTAAPLAGRLLGALGADVLKVEPPRGENARHLAQQMDGTGYLFYLNNTDKRGAVADLTVPAQRDQLLDLVKDADVFLTNLSDTALEGAGLDEPSIRQRADGVIYCSITGYGRTGPRAGQKAFDTVIQAQGGVMALTGLPDGAPLKVAISWADVVGASVAALAILGALHVRLDGRSGGALDVALLDGVVWSTQERWAEYYAGGREPARLGNAHHLDAPHGIYRCSDGWVALHVRNDREWPGLARLLGEPWTDAAFTTAESRVERGEELDRAIEAWTAPLPVARAVADLRLVDVVAEPVLDLLDVVRHPHTAARALLVPQRSPGGDVLTVLGTPWKFSRSRVSVGRPAPTLAQQELKW